MADIADIANDIAATMLAADLSLRTTTPTVVATGQCLFCEEALPDGQRWCGPECRDDWQRLQQRLQRKE